MMSRLRGWFDARYPMGPVRDFMRQQSTKPLPPHVSWGHTFGTVALFLLANQIVTGILLMVYYRATPENAFESVEFIMNRVRFGWLIRGLHAWGSTLMIVALIVHMFRTYWLGAYKRPREITWVLGVFLFWVVLAFAFTGYLLPWNQLSYWATVVGTEIAGAIPFVGEPMRNFLRGGDAVSGETLGRFYVAHVAVLPWVIVAITAIHLVLMRVQGLATLDPAEEAKGADRKDWIPFYPDHVFREGVVFSFLFMVILGVVFALPVELGAKADPMTTPQGIKPEWYFLPTYQLLKYFPKTLGIFVSFVPLLLMLVWPFLDRSPERRPRRRPWSAALGVLALVLALFFGALGWASERDFHVFGSTYHVDLNGAPHRVR